MPAEPAQQFVLLRIAGDRRPFYDFCKRELSVSTAIST